MVRKKKVVESEIEEQIPIVEPVDEAPQPIEPEVFEASWTVTQAEFDARLYALGFSGADTYAMWHAFLRDGIIRITITKA